MEQIYKLVDEIYCINLISRPDRYKIMKDFEKEENIKLNFFRPERHPDGGRMGCFTSHITIIQNAYDSGKNLIFIFEDDIIKTPSYKDICYNEINNFIKNNQNWEMLQFGSFNPINSLLVPMNTKYKNISQYYSFFASSYIINRKGMKKILDTYKNYIKTEHVDVFYQIIFNKTMYNIIPIIFDQDRTLENNNIWFNKYIDKIIMYIHVKSNAVYNLSLFKYNNGFIISYLLIFLIIYYLFKLYIKNKSSY
jgi:GR25 family glycosyltransferase involved in LPS biosynthesis